MTPDERHYFFTPATEAVFAEVRHLLGVRRGLLVLTGEVGLGKTTLLRRLLASLDRERFNTALVLTGFLGGDELLRAIAADFGLPAPAAAGRLDLLETLNEFLLVQTELGRVNVVVIDDAQALSAEALETVRQLGNLETASAKLVQVLLCGQPELLETLARRELRQVGSRVAWCGTLRPLDLAETRAYIRHRLAAAGGSPGPRLSNEAIGEIHRLTGGSPRGIHHLMDRCLYAVMASGVEGIDTATVQAARADLAWWREPPPAPAQAPPPCAAARRARPHRWWIAAAGGLASLAAAWAVVDVGHLSAAPSAGAVPREPAAAAVGVAAQPQAPLPRSADGALHAGALQGCPAPAEAAGAAGSMRAAADVPVSALSWGESHPALREVQQFLVARRWLDAAAADGLMGGRTAGALSRFQAAGNLPATGQFDPATARRLGCAMAWVGAAAALPGGGRP